MHTILVRYAYLPSILLSISTLVHSTSAAMVGKRSKQYAAECHLLTQHSMCCKLAAEKLATSAAHREERKQLESQIQTAEAATGAAEAVAARSAAVAMDATQALVTANKNLSAPSLQGL